MCNVSFFFWLSSRFLFLSFFLSPQPFKHSMLGMRVCVHVNVCVCVFSVNVPCLLCLTKDLSIASYLLLGMCKPGGGWRAFSVMSKRHPEPGTASLGRGCVAFSVFLAISLQSSEPSMHLILITATHVIYNSRE